MSSIPNLRMYRYRYFLKTIPVFLINQFCGAGAGGAATLAWLRVYKLKQNVTKSPKFFILKFEVELINFFFVAFYLIESFDDHLCLKKKQLLNH
jgi:hypothetical protein